MAHLVPIHNKRGHHRQFLFLVGRFLKIFSEMLSQMNPNLATNQKQELPFGSHVTDQNKMSDLYKGPVIDASYQVSVHLAEGLQRRKLK
jgi:hypothetical protein